MVIRKPFRHPETIESDGTQRQIMVILHLLSSSGGETNDMRRQIMVILHLLSSRGGEPDDMRRQIMVIRTPFRHAETIDTFCHSEAASPMTCGDK